MPRGNKMFHNQNSKTRLKDLTGKQSKSIFRNGSDKIRITGTAQRDGMGREEGGGFGMGNTCIPVADSF